MPPVSPFDDSLGADSLTLRVVEEGGRRFLRECIIRAGGGQEAPERLRAKRISYLQDGWKAFMVNTFSKMQAQCMIRISLDVFRFEPVSD